MAINNLSLIVCYAVAGGLAFLLGLDLFVTLFRHKRARKWDDVCFLIVAFLILFAGLVVGAFAVVCKFKPLSLSFARVDKKLLLLKGEKELFSVPAIGYAVTLFDKLALFGVIAPFAIALLALLGIIVTFAKTKRQKATAESAPAQVDQPAPAAAEAHAPQNEEAAAPAEESAHEEADASEEEAPSEPTEEASEEDIDEQALMGEVYKLISEAEETTSVEDDLAKAIKEGYALMDDFAEEKIEVEEADEEEAYESEEEAAEEEAYESEEEEAAEEEAYEPEEEAAEEEAYESEEEEAEEEAYESEEEAVEEEAYEPEEEAAEEEAYEPEEEAVEEPEEDAFDYASSAFALEAEAEEVEPPEEEEEAAVQDPVEIEPEETEAEEEEPIRPAAARVQPASRAAFAPPNPDVQVRTIVRPSSRVEQAPPAAEPKKPPAAEPKPAATAQKPSAPKKPRAPGAASTRQTPRKTVKKTNTGNRPQPRATEVARANQSAPKTVEPRSSGLPLTRKYIILNRHSAANAFNDYLSKKRAQEKAEITSSLNTIILK